MSENVNNSRWSEQRNDAEIVELRRYLELESGIKGLELLEADNTERAAELFHRDGFVVVGGVLNDEQIDYLKKGCDEVVNEIVALDEDHVGNRVHGGSVDADQQCDHQ